MQICPPDKVDLWKLAAAGDRLRGEIPLQRMPRLLSLLSAGAGEVTVALHAGVDESNTRFIAGHLETTVEVVCQRCMSPLRLPLVVDFRLGLIRTESQAVGLSTEYEPLLAPEGGTAMSEWVEDELILALPLAPLHDDVRECETHGFTLPGAYQALPAKQANPFAALSVLVNKQPED